MVNLFSTVIGFSCFFKSREDNTIKIDNVGFRLHYGFTAGFLFLCTALLGLTDMFGKNIQCRDQGGYYDMSDTQIITFGEESGKEDDNRGRRKRREDLERQIILAEPQLIFQVCKSFL